MGEGKRELWSFSRYRQNSDPSLGDRSCSCAKILGFKGRRLIPISTITKLMATVTL